MSRRKREAVRWFRAMLKGQSPNRAPFAGYAAFGVELGIPSRVAVDLAYSYVTNKGATLRQVEDAFMEEAKKWSVVS